MYILIPFHKLLYIMLPCVTLYMKSTKDISFIQQLKEQVPSYSEEQTSLTALCSNSGVKHQWLNMEHGFRVVAFGSQNIVEET